MNDVCGSSVLNEQTKGNNSAGVTSHTTQGPQQQQQTLESPAMHLSWLARDAGRLAAACCQCILRLSKQKMSSSVGLLSLMGLCVHRNRMGY